MSPDVLRPLADFEPLLARVYAAREVRHPDEVDYSMRRLRSYEGMLGLDEAVTLLEGAIRAGERILIVGDFDADGATSTAVAVRALRGLGAGAVDYLVPDRFAYGYGLTPEIVAVAAQRSPDLIVTVDNGISSHEGVASANQRGIRVIITDHHLPPQTLPAAAAIVNPNLSGDNSALGHLAGVGVIFYVMLALRAQLRAGGWFEQRSEPNLGHLLDLVALGTVADVATLDQNNRVLVAQGLIRLHRGQGQCGIRALLRVAKRDAARVSAADLGFAVGPRLNAAGRLSDMSVGIECLLCDDPDEAFRLAEALDSLNRERRTLEGEMTESAREQVAALDLARHGTLPAGLCLFDESWHPGIVGIIASRVKDEVHRPVIAFACDAQAALKGSGRSVPGLHIRDAIEAAAGRVPGVVERFGGHAMAAGLTLKREALGAFGEAFAAVVAERLDPDTLTGRHLSDGPLSAHELALPVAKHLRAGGPWGQGFPEPLFDGHFVIDTHRVVGQHHTKLTVSLAGGRASPLDAIAFNLVRPDLAPGVEVRLVYRLDVNVFRGRESVQLLVEDLRLAEETAL